MNTLPSERSSRSIPRNCRIRERIYLMANAADLLERAYADDADAMVLLGEMYQACRAIPGRTTPPA